MVSTLSEDFYRQQLPHTELRPLEDILHIEGAHGHTLPHKGYIEVTIIMPETGDTQTALLLIVPRTVYHKRTPVLLGTNVIRHCLANLKEDTEYAHE